MGGHNRSIASNIAWLTMYVVFPAFCWPTPVGSPAPPADDPNKYPLLTMVLLFSASHHATSPAASHMLFQVDTYISHWSCAAFCDLSHCTRYLGVKLTEAFLRPYPQECSVWLQHKLRDAIISMHLVKSMNTASMRNGGRGGVQCS